jgi:predicted glycoside hydrolase/deacetylase ChbG (UPF0249 family)
MVPTLINSAGLFVTPRELKYRWWTGQLKVSEMRAELCAQFSRLTEIMGSLDFWNTHQNSHIFPGLFQFFVNLGRELNIPTFQQCDATAELRRLEEKARWAIN